LNVLAARTGSTDDETTLCWGQSATGQLGNNSIMDGKVPGAAALTCP